MRLKMLLIGFNITDSKIHGANMGPTWVLSAPDGPHVGPWTLLSVMCSFDEPGQALLYGVYRLYIMSGLLTSTLYLGKDQIRGTLYPGKRTTNTETRAKI